MTGTFTVSFDRTYQHISFVVGIIGKLLQRCHAVFINAKIQLCAELHGCCRLPAHNGTYVRLADAHDPVRYRVNIVCVHVLLLIVHLFQHRIPHKLSGRKLHVVQEERFYISEITAYVLRLLLNCLTDLFRCTLFTLCKVQVIRSGILAIGTGSIVVIVTTDPVNQLFPVFLGFI